LRDRVVELNVANAGVSAGVQGLWIEPHEPTGPLEGGFAECVLDSVEIVGGSRQGDGLRPKVDSSPSSTQMVVWNEDRRLLGASQFQPPSSSCSPRSRLASASFGSLHKKLDILPGLRHESL
jgi:hypothetical protein